jgi:hypothetical protein
VYIIAHCSSLNRTTFFSLYVCCPVLDLTPLTQEGGLSRSVTGLSALFGS